AETWKVAWPWTSVATCPTTCQPPLAGPPEPPAWPVRPVAFSSRLSWIPAPGWPCLVSEAVICTLCPAVISCCWAAIAIFTGPDRWPGELGCGDGECECDFFFGFGDLGWCGDAEPGADGDGEVAGPE